MIIDNDDDDEDNDDNDDDDKYDDSLVVVFFQCQYIFVHDALLHYIESGFRLAIPIDDLKDYVHKLENNRSNQSTLDIEFQVRELTQKNLS